MKSKGCKSITARGGHHSRVLHLGEAEVADHDLGVLVGRVVEQILGLQEKQ